MAHIDLETLISTGRHIQKGLKYRPSPPNVFRSFEVYDLDDVDEYYNWKELSIRFLQQYGEDDPKRFIQYSKEFEEHYYLPKWISNMVGVLEACKVIPTKQMAVLLEDSQRETEVKTVLDLENDYLEFVHSDRDVINSIKAIDAFHKWHAAASVLFDKCFYPGDEDFVSFQSIDGSGNGYSLNHEYDKIFTVYQKLLSRIREGRGVKYARSTHRRQVSSNALPDDKISIFISYSHADKKWLDKLERHLKVLKRFIEPIEYWDDKKIKGGDKWKEEIEKAITKANVAILLVSTDFLSSDFIATDELPPLLRKAEEEGTRILPLIVAPCAFTLSELSEFQAINDPEKTLADLGDNEAAIERTFLELVKSIQELLPAY